MSVKPEQRSCALDESATLITCGLGAIEKGAEDVEIQVVVRVDADLPDDTVLANGAAVTAKTYDNNNGNDNATAYATVNNVLLAGLSIQKILSSLISVAGEEVTHTIHVTNKSDKIANGVAAADVAGGRWVIELTVNSDRPLAINGVAVVSSSEHDPNSNTNIDRLDQAFACSTQGTADLALTKSVVNAEASITAGSVISYSLAYKYWTIQDAGCVAIVDPVPNFTTFHAGASDSGWSCIDGAPAGTSCMYFVGSLPGGGEGEVIFAVTVLDSLPESVTISNTASLQSATSDPEQANNASGASVEVTIPTGLTVLGQPAVGDNQTFLPLIDSE